MPTTYSTSWWMKLAYKIRGCECRQYCHSEDNPCRERPKNREDLANFDVAHFDASNKTHWYSAGSFSDGDGPASASRYGLGPQLDEYLKSQVLCKPCHIRYDNHKEIDCSPPPVFEPLPLIPSASRFANMDREDALRAWIKETTDFWEQT